MASILGGSGIGRVARPMSQTTVSQAGKSASCRRTAAMGACPSHAKARTTDRPTNPLAPVTRTRMASSPRPGHERGDPVRIRVIESILDNPELSKPTLDLLDRVLPGVMRVIPVEIDHVVDFKIESVVPEAFDEPVVDQALHIVRSGRDVQDVDGLGQRDLGIEAAELTPELGKGPAGRIAFLGRHLGEVPADILIAELTRGPHLLVDVEEKLAAGPDLLVERTHCRTRIRGMVQDTVGDDQVEA